MASYSKEAIAKKFNQLGTKLGKKALDMLIEQALDRGYIERTRDLGFTVTKRGEHLLSEDAKAAELRKQLAKPKQRQSRKAPAKPKKKEFVPVQLEPHERKFAHLFSHTWNAIGFDVHDAMAEELEEMTPDVIAEVILDASHIETYCRSDEDKALIKELRALPYEEQLRLCTGENFGF